MSNRAKGAEDLPYPVLEERILNFVPRGSSGQPSVTSMISRRCGPGRFWCSITDPGMWRSPKPPT